MTRKTYFARKCLALLSPFLLAQCGVPSEDITSGFKLDGVALDPQPIDINTHCNYQVLRGTERFRGTYFIVPKVYISKDKSNKPIFSIVNNPKTASTDPDTFTLDFGIYIQRANEIVDAANHPLNDDKLPSCNFQALREQIDSRFANTPEYKAYEIAPLPISNIEIRIVGIPGKTYLVAPEGTNTLNWQGDDFVANFNLSRSELDLLLHRIQEVGFQSIVSLQFQARETVSFASLNYDGSKVAKALENALGGATKIKGLVLAEAEFRSKLAATMKSVSISGAIESDDKDFISAATALLTKMADSDPSIMVDGSQQQPNNNYPGNGYNNNNPYYPPSPYTPGGIDPLPPPPPGPTTGGNGNNGTGTNSTNPNGDPNTGGVTLPSQPSAEYQQHQGPKVHVGAALQYLRSQVSKKIEYRVMGGKLDARAVVATPRLRGHVGEQDFKPYTCVSDTPATNTQIIVDKDETVIIIPKEYTKSTVQFKEQLHDICRNQSC